MKLPIPAPTNEPQTCIFCGRKLKFSHFRTIDYADAGPEARAVWPKVYYYSKVEENDLVLGWRYDCPPDSTYEGASYARTASVPVTEHGCGLRKYTGSSYSRERGDRLFCSTPCAVGFARIAANAGLRLPSMDRRGRRQFRQHMRFIQTMCPDVLSFSSDEQVPNSQRVPTKNQDRAEMVTKVEGRLVFRPYAADGAAAQGKGLIFRMGTASGRLLDGQVPELDPTIPAPKKRPRRGR